MRLLPQFLVRMSGCHGYTEIAETADEVEIFQGTNRTQSKGLRIEMQTGKLTLQNKVTSRYNPPAS